MRMRSTCPTCKKSLFGGRVTDRHTRKCRKELASAAQGLAGAPQHTSSLAAGAGHGNGNIAAQMDAFSHYRPITSTGFDEVAFDEALRKVSDQPPGSGPLAQDLAHRQGLRAAAQQLAATPAGQVRVLDAAMESVKKSGSLAVANILLDAALHGQTQHDAGVDARDWNGRTPPRKYSDYAAYGRTTHFDHTQNAVDQFEAACATPTHIAAYNNVPARALRYDPLAAQDALTRVANGVLYGKNEPGDNLPPGDTVYSPALREQARKFSSGMTTVGDPRQPEYIRADLAQFVSDVSKAQRADRTLVKERIAREQRRAQSLAFASSSAGQDRFAL